MMTIENFAEELRLEYIGKNWRELASDDSLTHKQYLLELLQAEYEQRQSYVRNNISICRLHKCQNVYEDFC